ncbi:MAG: ABC transporter ATP-binding protein [Ruminococcaceae bacterium]|nr:ABC transporter ATP-binding protein [Oscillospiraceae bacterium]
MLLKVDNIVVSYGEFQALHGISLEVEEGTITALLGSNGAGKTTTIKTISGQLIPKSGTLHFNGEDITHMPIHERVGKGIVQVPEGRKLFPYMSVEENLLAGSYLPGARKLRAQNLERCYEILPKLKERRKQLAGSLSGGEQQMCAIARGIMATPKLLVMDEPSLGLAPIIVENIFDTINKLKSEGMTILLVEQNVASSLTIADRAYVIETGENVMNGTGAELKSNEDLQKAYLGI